MLTFNIRLHTTNWSLCHKFSNMVSMIGMTGGAARPWRFFYSTSIITARSTQFLIAMQAANLFGKMYNLCWRLTLTVHTDLWYLSENTIKWRKLRIRKVWVTFLGLTPKRFRQLKKWSWTICQARRSRLSIVETYSKTGYSVCRTAHRRFRMTISCASQISAWLIWKRTWFA